VNRPDGGDALSGENGYILTEIWRARPAWLALPIEDRRRYFDETVGPLLGGLVDKGAEIPGD